VVQSGLRQGLEVGELQRVWWWLVGGRFGLQWFCTSGEILAPVWPELVMVTAAAATCFLGSIAVKCAHSCARGLDSGGKPRIRDRALEALLCLFPVGGIASESPTVRVWERMVAVGLLCEVQVCSLAKMMTRAEDGSRRGFVSRFYLACPMGSPACRAAVESEVRCLRGDDDRLRVVCKVLGRRKTRIIPL
jgi:hypothetical protein